MDPEVSPNDWSETHGRFVDDQEANPIFCVMFDIPQIFTLPEEES